MQLTQPHVQESAPYTGSLQHQKPGVDRRSKILHPATAAEFAFLGYRYQFLFHYVLIGVLSIALEVGIVGLVLRLNGAPDFAVPFGVAVGIAAAYWLNVRFNFKVPPRKRQRALVLFVGISLLSLALNFALKSYLSRFGLTYAQARFASSGLLFLVAYSLHRRFTFSDAKKVGIAIYADHVEDIRAIWDKVGSFPSFIHVDVVDESFNPAASPPSMARQEVVRAFWPQSEIHVHLMSKRPTQWLSSVVPYCDRILVHAEIDEPLPSVLAEIERFGKQSGLCLRVGTSPEIIRPFVDRTSMVMVLAIAQPGKSGQEFQRGCIETLDELNSWPERVRFSLCVDGGVNERNIGELSVENVVSGSAVLNHPQPHRQIMRLRTSSSYESFV